MTALSLARSSLETQSHNSVLKTPIFLEFLGQILRLIFPFTSEITVLCGHGEGNSINEEDTIIKN